MNDQLKIYAEKKGWGKWIDLYLTTSNRDAIAEPILMKKLTDEERAIIQQPTFSLNLIAAQELIDRLWDCGIRPTEGSGSAGSLKATQNHLEDMRALVFKTPKPKQT